MSLHPQAKQRLLEEFKKCVAAIRVKNGLFVDSFIAFLCFHQAEEVLPKTGKLRALFEDWVDDSPITTFVTDRLRQELRSHSKYDSDDTLKKLSDLEGFGDTDALAGKLLDEFESLPWHYMMTVRFPEVLPPFPTDQTTVQLGKSSRLAVSDLFFRESYPLDHADEEVRNRVLKGSGALSILIADEFKWEEGVPYFQYEASGFVGPYGSGVQFDGANRALKRFVGLGLGMKLFTHEHQFSPYPKRHRWLIHIESGENWEIHERLEMDLEDSTVLDSLKLWNGFEKAYPEAHKVPWLQGLVTRIGKSLCHTPNSTLGLAAEWFFDSFKGRDETLTYVRRMTCLEILLGEHADTSKISLGELLGNRLAYLIGRSHADREAVLKDFREIYGLRSRILHHGKHRFTREERAKLWNLRSFCERALQEEAKLLTADVAGA